MIWFESTKFFTINKLEMKNLLFLCLLAIFGLQACGSESGKAAKDKDKLREDITALEERLREQQNTLDLDTASAITLLEKVDTYHERYPQDSLTPHLLYRNADLSRGIGKPEEAISTWNTLIREYREFPKLPEAMFFRAFTADNDLQDKEMAEKYYEAFIRAYPDHPMKTDAKALLDVLKSGKSPDEIIEEFQKKRESIGE